VWERPIPPGRAEVAQWPGGSAERSDGRRLRRGRFEVGTARRGGSRCGGMRELEPGLKMECDILDALEALG